MPGAQPITNDELGAHSPTGGASAAFTPVGLRECVYGVAARNFRRRATA